MFYVTGMRQQKHLGKRITGTWLENHLVSPEEKGKTYVCYLLCMLPKFSAVIYLVL